MPAPEPFAAFLEPIERLGFPYCITGSVAASVYGEPRLTADIDVVLVLGLEKLPAFRAAFPEADYYVPPDETLRAALGGAMHGMFNVVHHRSQFKADLYLAGSDALHAWALAHRRRIDLGGTGAWIAPPEYVVIRKLEFHRDGGSDKHLRDCRFILAATALDRNFLDAEIARRGLGAQWRALASGMPDSTSGA